MTGALAAFVPRTHVLLLAVIAGACRLESTATAPRATAAAVPADEPAPAPDRAALVAELRASFPELAAYRPAPDLQLPPWLSRDTVWFAEAGRCYPLRRVPGDPTRRAVEFCSTVVEFAHVSCSQRVDIDDHLQIRRSYGCQSRNSFHGSGGSGARKSYLLDRTGKPFPDDSRGPFQYEDGSPTWAPVAVSGDHVVFADTWRFWLRDESQARVESTCDPDSLARARAAAQRDPPSASPAELAALLEQRHGIESDGTRSCVIRGDEQLQRGRRLPTQTFTPRVRNVRTEDIVDCTEPCPDDPARRTRLDRFLAATPFVAEAGGESLVLYESRPACQAGTRRSTVSFSTEPCHD